MQETTQGQNIRRQLILAGMDELDQYGVQHFSVRRIAKACGISCAAPYKHFADKDQFIAAIIEYINSQWHQRQQEILRQFPSNTRRQLLEISMAYVQFLVENPHFRSIIMMRDRAFDQKYSQMRGGLTELSRQLVERYCREVQMPEKTAVVKTYIVRSLIYGAALMFDNGEVAYTQEMMEAVREAINREFDLP